jgi:hypothetical protein
MNLTEASTHAAIAPLFGAPRAEKAQSASNGAGLAARAEPAPLHRLRTVRRQQGVTVRTIARGRRVSLEQVLHEQCPQSDLRLTTVYEWQYYLEVPVADLLIESQEPLSPPVAKRARMVKLMKTIATIRERAESEEIKELAESLFKQAIEIMPELAEVQPWQSVGQRRTLDEVGRIAEQQLPDDFFAGFGG